MIIPALLRNRDTQGHTFAVDEVTPANGPLPLNRLGTSFELRSGRSIFVMPEQDDPAVVSPRMGGFVHFVNEPGMGLRRNPLRDKIRRSNPERTFLHPLIEAVHVAFSQHRPLILSPDSIWLVISQGFGHHIHQNAEALRERLVRHSGRKTLTIVAGKFDASAWQGYIADFSSQIREASDPVLHETLLCDFSTTTPTIKTASEVALMDVYERYFEYEMICICGIPEITVTGAPDDWRRMRARVEVLATYGLEGWVSRVRPVLDEFVSAAEGRPNLSFWKAIYKPEQVYAGQAATGWIADLFPYLSRSDGLFLNPVLRHPRTDWTVPVNKGIGPGAFPSGLSRAPITLRSTDGSTGATELMAGFFGVGQRPEDNALFPMINWAVANPEKPTPVARELQTCDPIIQESVTEENRNEVE